MPRTETIPGPRPLRAADLRLRRTGPVRYEVPAVDGMRVPGVLFASEALLPGRGDETLGQVANVATLPGIVGASYAMPDLHWGYGFPIGGVAAADVDADGVISPGGVGFDISCGVRALLAPCTLRDAGDRLPALMDELSRAVPRGAGPGGVWRLRGEAELRRVLREGAEAAVAAGHGRAEDLARCEDGGRLPDADADHVSARALQRGLQQVGSLGSGNHFLELQVVERVVDEGVAARFGLFPGRLVVTVHCGSRGLGHQVCSDHVRGMQAAMGRHGIQVADRQLACAPVRSPEGEAYLGAMAAAANYGRANRQVLGHAADQAFTRALGSGGLEVLYDVSHNMAKLERHATAGADRLVCVHRKGATLALPPGHPDLPDDLRDVGQPVLIPGSMGTASWILAGVGGEAFHSTCHGAGRALSRKGARKLSSGRDVRDQLERRGILVRAKALGELAEEAPAAYKDVDEVVEVCEAAGLSRRVARLRPLGVVKG